ncbi:hypothetical protein RUM44_006296 [Polyplax serrata]|uniref:G-protein coupled receptors family 1 profile domain-containing protein n=1 Tax=Polyplax serrata TaxID=468196 RepID=A0ABR1AJE6_POLSC
METLGMMEPYDADVFNCSALVLPNNTVCLEHPEEMLKPWKTHPMFFEIIVIHVIIFVFGVVGNVVVIIVMAGDRKSRSATNFFLVSLAVGDLLMLCVYGPLETYTHFVIKWDETGAICKTAKFAEFVSATSSVLNLLAVTVERFVVIVFPMKSQTICTVSNMVRAVVSVWILSLLLAFPVVLTTSTYKITFTNNVTSLTLNYCTSSGDSPDFVVYQFFIIFFIPSVTMTVCYSFVIRELWVSTKKMNLMTNGVSFKRRLPKPPILFLRRNNSKANKEAAYPMVDVSAKYPDVEDSSNPRRTAVFARSFKKTCVNCPEDVGRGASHKSETVVTTSKDEANHARKQVRIIFGI